MVGEADWAGAGTAEKVRGFEAAVRAAAAGAMGVVGEEDWAGLRTADKAGQILAAESVAVAQGAERMVGEAGWAGAWTEAEVG